MYKHPGSKPVTPEVLDRFAMHEHYIAMHGQHGCLPNTCEVFDDRLDAVNFAVDTAVGFLWYHYGPCCEHKHSDMSTQLTDSGYFELPQNMCVEITACTCSQPEIHSDGGH